MLGGYTPDRSVMAKDIYKAGYKGAILGPSFAINAKFIEGVGPDVAEGIWNMDRGAAVRSPAYKEFSAAVPRGDQSPYAPQAWDQIRWSRWPSPPAKGEVSGTASRTT